MAVLDRKTGLTDLPADVLLNIIPHLGPKDLLSLCSTSRVFLDLRLEPSYWRRLTCATYRLPNQPLLRSDGARWKALYQRLQSQSRVYTWGKSGSRLGRHIEGDDEIDHGSTIRRYGSYEFIAWPSEVCDTKDMDPVVDLQCGGWSTTILTSKGELFTAGSLESRGHGVGGSLQALKRLRFPLEYPNGKDRLPAAAIAQFSSGRSHILGLSDSGDVWFWDYKSAPGWKINFLHSDVPAAELTTNDTARVTRVVAGWDCSSAYVAGKGILVWKIPQARFSPRPVQNGAMKAIMAVEDGVVPSTHYQRPKRRARHASNEHEMLGKDVGEVTSHLALEGYIVFLTDLGKVFAARHATSTTLDQGIVELDGFEPSQGKAKMTQIEGSFRSFAVFNTDGDVVLGNCDQLDRAWKNLYERGSGGEILTVPQPIRPAALQNRGVISLAFGDWHQLALTAKGDVLSFGKEPQLCGCLGLGTYSGEGYLRGVRSGGHFGANDGDSGGRWRRIFFSPEQREWLRYMRRGGMDTETGRQELAETATNAQRHLQLADWFEEKGAEWDRHPNLETSAELGASTEPAYKVVSISAAGWHCGALVLADDEKIRRMYRAHAGFLPIPNGYEVSDLASRVWNSISALWKRTTETQQPEVPPTIDQYFGRDHRYYYSPKPWDVIRRNLPEEARHEVVFPVIEGASGEQEL